MIKMIEEVKYIMFIINGGLVDYSNISLGCFFNEKIELYWEKVIFIIFGNNNYLIKCLVVVNGEFCI